MAPENIAFPVNADFETELDVDEESKTYLKIHNEGRVNRQNVTADAAGHSSFYARLDRVLYGTYDGQPACLVALNFSFRFRSEALCRYIVASIEVSFRHAADIQNPRISSSPEKDPFVKNLAPAEVYGELKTANDKKFWELEVPVMFSSPVGVKTGVTGKKGVEHNFAVDKRTELHGDLAPDDDHPDEPNSIIWDLSEDPVQKKGIFRRFTGAVVVQNAANSPMWMHVIVKPAVKFSLNPQRLFLKESPAMQLLQRNDDPVLLDGKTSRSPFDDQAFNVDFNSSEFPWNRVVVLPTEHSNQLTLVSRNTGNPNIDPGPAKNEAVGGEKPEEAAGEAEKKDDQPEGDEIEDDENIDPQEIPPEDTEALETSNTADELTTEDIDGAN